jgi:hypothetical protein
MNLTVIFMIAVCVLFIGCGVKGRQVYPATGKVLYNGKPLGDAQIIFKPKEESGVMAVAITESNGSFSLITSGAEKNGAVAGEYDVIIEKNIPVDEKGNPIALLQSQPSKAPTMDSTTTSPQVTHRPKMKSVIPEKYTQYDKPVLKAVVNKKTNDYLFELNDD